MSSLLDVVFAMILGAMLLLIIINANNIAGESWSIYNGNMLVQEILIGTAQLVESEFRNMGFNVPDNELVVTSADSTQIQFRYDVDRNGTIDVITYWEGDTSELSTTMNEMDRFLHRRVNGGPIQTVGTVTRFSLLYLTQSGEVLPLPVPADRLSEIRLVEITMEVQNPYAMFRSPEHIAQYGGRDAFYSSSLWRQTRLASQNLSR
jgi:hypothetical protein